MSATPSDLRTRPRWLPAVLRPRRRRIGAVAVVLLVVAGIVLAIVDPFNSTASSGAGVGDNSYPTAIATVKERSLTSQTQVNATLGYAGSYTISLPSGTASSDVTSAESAVTTDENAVTTDETALSQANTQLSEDEHLDCPAASSATVTSAVSAGATSDTGSNPGSGSTGSGNTGAGNTGSGNTGSGNTGSGSSGSGNTGSIRTTSDDSGTHSAGSSGGPTTTDTTVTTSSPAPSTTNPGRKPAPPTFAPVVFTGTASSTTNSTATLAGTVNPGGNETSYWFRWGTGTPFAHSTPAQTIRGSSAVSVSASLSGLAPNTTYGFELVASNAQGTVTGTEQAFETAASSCVAEQAVIAEDTQALDSDEASRGAAETALQLAQSEERNSGSTFTWLPAAGKIISRGQPVYELDEHPVPLFYGTTTLYRALYLGVSPGPDVTELQANLIALGFGNGITASDQFTAATEAEVKSWQASIGVPQTGVVDLGDVVLAPGAIEVNAVSAARGSTASPGGAVLTANSRKPVVTIALDASEQSEVKVGDKVVITLPNNSTTPGVVTSVGKVATSSSSGGSGSGGSATVTVIVTPTSSHGTKGLDQASVEVAITTGSVSHALVVPVDALLALASGGYAIEVVPAAGGPHELVGVSLGLFDDAAGLVQVSGSGVSAGEHVVIPKP